jgi:hypothetical protein
MELISLADSQRNLYDKYQSLCIQYWTPDDGQQTCPKHVEFYTKINLRQKASRWYLLYEILLSVLCSGAVGQETCGQQHNYSCTA